MTNSPNIYLLRRFRLLHYATKHRIDISAESKSNRSLSAFKRHIVSAGTLHMTMKDTDDVYGQSTHRKEENECGERPRFGESESTHGGEHWTDAFQ